MMSQIVTVLEKHVVLITNNINDISHNCNNNYFPAQDDLINQNDLIDKTVAMLATVVVSQPSMWLNTTIEKWFYNQWIF